MAAANKAGHLGPIFSVVLPIAAFLIGTASAHAQAKPGASRTAELSAYGAYSYVKPDFGEATINNTGAIIGVNYTRFLFKRIAPSLEARATYNTGDAISYKSFGGGFRGTYDFRDRFHPYAAILVGGGTLKYNHYLGFGPDRGTVITGAVGINVDAYKTFQVMLDASSQHWNLGKMATLKPNGDDYTLSPTLYSFGISYRVPARSHSKIADRK